MKFFIDTEFIERGRHYPLVPISIGIVSETNATYYAVSSEFKEEDCSDWVKRNVLPHLIDERLTVPTIAREIFDFVVGNCKGDDKPEFWGYYADYDWVILCQMFGTMMNLPEGWPMYCNDLKQLAMTKGNPRLPKSTGRKHNALADAIWVREAYAILTGTRG